MPGVVSTGAKLFFLNALTTVTPKGSALDRKIEKAQCRITENFIKSVQKRVIQRDMPQFIAGKITSNQFAQQIIARQISQLVHKSGITDQTNKGANELVSAIVTVIKESEKEDSPIEKIDNSRLRKGILEAFDKDMEINDKTGLSTKIKRSFLNIALKIGFKTIHRGFVNNVNYENQNVKNAFKAIKDFNIKRENLKQEFNAWKENLGNNLNELPASIKQKAQRLEHALADNMDITEDNINKFLEDAEDNLSQLKSLADREVQQLGQAVEKAENQAVELIEEGEALIDEGLNHIAGLFNDALATVKTKIDGTQAALDKAKNDTMTALLELNEKVKKAGEGNQAVADAVTSFEVNILNIYLIIHTLHAAHSNSLEELSMALSGSQASTSAKIEELDKQSALNPSDRAEALKEIINNFIEASKALTAEYNEKTKESTTQYNEQTTQPLDTIEEQKVEGSVFIKAKKEVKEQTTLYLIATQRLANQVTIDIDTEIDEFSAQIPNDLSDLY